MTVRFATIIAHMSNSLVFRLMCDAVRDQCAAIAKSTWTLCAGEWSLRFGQMVLYMILQYARTRQQFVALRTSKGIRLQMACHMQCHCSGLNQFDATAYHIAFHSVCVHIMMIQFGEIGELRTSSVQRKTKKIFSKIEIHVRWRKALICLFT